MRRFVIVRETDGVWAEVIEGVQFSDGRVAVRWMSDRGSTVAWDSVEDVCAISAGGPRNRFVWVD